MSETLGGLNSAQRAAVTSDASVLQVLAPPGSGKTKTLTTRVAHLISKRQMRPWNIITCTFTKKAANEMKDRIRGFVGAEMARQIKLGTFHAVAVQYLKQYGHHIALEKDFGIADSSDSKAILKRIIKKGQYSMEPGQALGRISGQKMKGTDCEQVLKSAKHIEQQEFGQIFMEYEAELKASNLLDYDDLLLRCCFLLRTHPQCVSNVEAVLIDEFQDTNNVQYDLMGLLAQKRNHITIVGDPDQSIYGFRNAEIANLARMRRQWPDTVTINLEDNYRSSGAILHAAQNIIEQDKTRPPKKLQATHSPGQRPVLRKLPSAAAEAQWLVAEIRRISALTAHVLKPNDFAILLRSAALSRVIETALGKEGVPYRMVGGKKFWDRYEVKTIMDYLRVVNQPNNSEATERIINIPTRGIGDATLKSLREEAKSKDLSLWKLVLSIAQGRATSATKLSGAASKGLGKFVSVVLGAQQKMVGSEEQTGSLVDVINFIMKKIDYQTHLKNRFENELDSRWPNVEELVIQAAEASDPQRLAAMVQEDSLPDIAGIDKQSSSDDDVLSIFLANVALTSSVEEKAKDGGEPPQQVTISTIHSAKGLEWPVVFIPACYEGSIPHSRSEDTDEERRLLYVGMTRAQAMLYLSCPVKNTQRDDTSMSSFLTAPGASAFFEEHGPSLALHSATGLAITLGREPPSVDDWTKGKSSLEKDEDDYWPLNGEDNAENLARWDYGKCNAAGPATSISKPANLGGFTTATMQQSSSFSASSATMSSGFVSLKDKYEEIESENRLKAMDDKRAKAQKKAESEAPKGRKRQIEGQATIAGFFAKRGRPSNEAHPPTITSQQTSFRPARRGTKPLSDISNIEPLHEPDSLPSKPPLKLPAESRKPRTAPLSKRPFTAPRTAPANSDYLFLSSSPPQPQTDAEAEQDPFSEAAGIVGQRSSAPHPGFRPASTFHSTSMEALQQAPPRARTLGARPRMNSGWANRGRGR